MAATRHPGVEPLDESGTYRLRIRVRNQRTGQRINTMRHFRGTLKQAVIERNRLMKEFAEGDLDVTDARRQTTLGVFAKRWIEIRKAKGEKYSTRRAKIQVLTHHILPRFGDMYVESILPRDVNDWLIDASRQMGLSTGKPLSPVTINLWLRMLKACVSAYYKEEALGPSPIAAVEALKEPPRPPTDPNSLPLELIAKVLARFRELYPQHFAMLFIGLTTGMRWSELSALVWDDIDETMGLIHLQRGQVAKRIDTPKEDKLIDLPLLPEMVEVLRWHRKRLVERQAAGLDKGLVFPSVRGDYSYASRFEKPLRRVCQELGITFRVSSKVMRRTFNNVLRLSAVNGLVLRSLTGHSSEAMTALYSTITEKERQDAVAKVIEITRSPKQQATPPATMA